MREIARAGDGSPSLFNAGLGYLLFSALEAFRKAELVSRSAEIHPAVEKAAHLLKAEGTGLSEEALAGRVGLSRSHLSRLFRVQTGVPLVHFRNRQRLNRFLGLYGSGQRLTMLDAALAAGFGSYAQFYRVFRSFMGCAPADHRQTRA
jgi:transcriptional regulator GlxA family with amidase domain